LRFVKQVATMIRIPWVAIGGIDLDNIQDVVAAGATRVAVVRAIFAARDPESAAQLLRQQLRRFSVNSKGLGSTH
jgi:thiamine-phosphate pyrophosphorylase